MGLSQAFSGFMAGADASTAETVQKTVGAVNDLVSSVGKMVGKKASKETTT